MCIRKEKKLRGDFDRIKRWVLVEVIIYDVTILKGMEK